MVQMVMQCSVDDSERLSSNTSASPVVAKALHTDDGYSGISALIKQIKDTTVSESFVVVKND